MVQPSFPQTQSWAQELPKTSYSISTNGKMSTSRNITLPIMPASRASCKYAIKEKAQTIIQARDLLMSLGRAGLCIHFLCFLIFQQLWRVLFTQSFQIGCMSWKRAPPCCIGCPTISLSDFNWCSVVRCLWGASGFEVFHPSRWICWMRLFMSLGSVVIRMIMTPNSTSQLWVVQVEASRQIPTPA